MSLSTTDSENANNTVPHYSSFVCKLIFIILPKSFLMVPPKGFTEKFTYL